MDLRQRRLEKGWSQEQLSDISGISVRTVQRLESGERAGLETQKILAAIFEVSLSEIKDHQNGDTKKETPMSDSHTLKKEPFLNRDWKFFLLHLGILMVVMTWILALTSYFELGFDSIGWVAYLWGMFLIIHFIKVIGSSDSDETKDSTGDGDNI